MQGEKRRHAKDLYVRTSWADAALALAQIEKGKAEGRRTALWFRAILQAHLFQLGCFLQQHAGKVLFVALLVLSSFCVGLKSAVVHSRVEQLWVEEGGRLENELRYASAALGEQAALGSTHQLVVQVARDPGASLLHPSALQAHLRVLAAATSVNVHLFDITWKLKDLCYSPSVPNFDVHYIDQIFENMIPCAIITPLDCFWEGSKLLGPDYPVNIPGVGPKVRWTNLNPQQLVERMRSYDNTFPFDTLEQHMKRAGISTGYQEKPCLDPTDSECPDTAPNKRSGQAPDVGAELTGGCYGFAAKYMHWPEDLLVGGAKRNKTGHINRAQALQTVVQLMGERELYEFWSDTYKVHHVDWSQEKAAKVLDTWQRKFSEEVRRQMSANTTSPYNMLAFSTATLNEILNRFSEINLPKLAVGYVIVLLYAALSLFKWDDPVKSQAAVGVAGVVLISLTVAAGLGFCAVLGIPFNASTTQIVPFLALGLGVSDMFLITHTYAEQSPTESHPDEQTGVLLKKTGLSIMLVSIGNIAAFSAAAIIPIPALRAFSLQVALLLLFNSAVTLLVFPALVSLDLRRRRSGRVDLLCCCLPGMDGVSQWPCIEAPPKKPKKLGPDGKKLQAITRALPPDRQQTVTVLAQPSPVASSRTNGVWVECGEFGKGRRRLEEMEEGVVGRCGVGPREEGQVKSVEGETAEEDEEEGGAASCYARLILGRPSSKAITVLLMVTVLVGSIWGLTRVTDGLDLTDVVPQNTDEHTFLGVQSRYFGFYNMYAVTQGDFEYPTNQRLLYEYHEAFMRVPSIIKNDDGGLPEFWLGLFRDWLIGLQKAFDRDWSRGSITRERWYSNASDEGILAYKLLVQTGHVDNPVDKSLVTQVRLVDSEGIINSKAFYNYLSAWASNDALAYGASQANLRPEPKPWFHAAGDFELRIPKSAPLVYSQLPFYLHGLGDTTKITKLISQVREVCARFELRGLPNFPSGIPFLFWEQYLTLRRSLGAAMLCALAAVFVAVSVVLVNWAAAAILTLALALTVVQLSALMGALGIKLSAVPAVLLVVAVGFGLRFTVNILLSFLTGIGGKERRARMAVRHMFTPVLHGALATLLAVLMLGFSEFDFIIRYFFYMPVAVVGIGLVNGLLFFPVLLSLIGPVSEVVPLAHPDRISTPSPEPARRIRGPPCRAAAPPPRRHHGSSGHHNHHHHHHREREPSLTTITEEPNSWHSATHEIVVEPEFVVETTTCTHPPQNAANEGGPLAEGCDGVGVQRVTTQSQSHVTTKVTATAKVKVEVHTPIHGGGGVGGGSTTLRSGSLDSLCTKSQSRLGRRRDSGSGSSCSDSSDSSGRHS